jgi:hypothetical protein
VSKHSQVDGTHSILGFHFLRNWHPDTAFAVDSRPLFRTYEHSNFILQPISHISTFISISSLVVVPPINTIYSRISAPQCK